MVILEVFMTDLRGEGSITVLDITVCPLTFPSSVFHLGTKPSSPMSGSAQTASFTWSAVKSTGSYSSQGTDQATFSCGTASLLTSFNSPKGVLYLYTSPGHFSGIISVLSSVIGITSNCK